MKYAVEVAPAAGRQLRKLPKPAQRRIVSRLEALEEDPRPSAAKKLSGKRALYRVRVGSYRIVYRVNDQAVHVLVVKIGDRKAIYRKILDT